MMNSREGNSARRKQTISQPWFGGGGGFEGQGAEDQRVLWPRGRRPTHETQLWESKGEVVGWFDDG